MTRATESSPSLLSPLTLPAPLLRVKESGAVDDALRLARSGALTAARGAGRAGLFLGRQGASIAKKGLERAKTIPLERVVAGKIDPTPARVRTAATSPRRRQFILLAAVGAGIAAGVLLRNQLRKEHPPVASAPPSLRDAEATPIPGRPGSI